MPLPVEVDSILRHRFGVATFSGAYGTTEASLVSWQPPGVENKPNAAGVINDQHFDVRIFDDDDHELAWGPEGEIVIRPLRPHTMFEGYWGRPEATVEASRNWWYHTGDVGRIDEADYLFFVDRKADYLRRRGENISSFEVERADEPRRAGRRGRPRGAQPAHRGRPQGHRHGQGGRSRDRGGAVPLVRGPAAVLRPAPLHRVPRRAAPLARGPGAQADLRAEGVTAATWDAEAAGITYERR